MDHKPRELSGQDRRPAHVVRLVIGETDLQADVVPVQGCGPARDMPSYFVLLSFDAERGELTTRHLRVAPGAIPRMSHEVELTKREVDTLREIMVGSPNKVIARKLRIAEGTVKIYVKSVLRKLGLDNRTQAAIWAAGHGWR